MSSLFFFCAVIGGTILVCQLALTLLGLGGHDVGGADHGGMDVVHDAPHDFGHTDGPGHDHGGADHHDGQQHLSTWLFGVISFRTLVAAVTFFGIGGMAAWSAELHPVNQVLVALACGVAAMYLVHALILLLFRLGEDHTVRVQRAIGEEGLVHVAILGDRAGAGKIQLRLQGRLMEFGAVTAVPAGLPSGSRVVVVAVLGGDLLEVAPVPRPTTTPAGT